jgi:hypothetical protein
MHSKSTIARAKPQPELVFALEFMLFGAEMPLNKPPFRLGVLQLVEEVKSVDSIPDFLDGKRRISVHKDDVIPAGAVKEQRKGEEYCVIRGLLKEVIRQEKILRQRWRVKDVIISLLPPTDEPLMRQQILDNLRQLHEDRLIFTPLKFLWRNAHGMKVEMHMAGIGPHFKIEGRRQDTQRFRDHFDLWKRQLSGAPVVERPDHFMAVDLYRRPRALPSGDEEFRERLHVVTAQSLSETQMFLRC